MIIIKQNWWQLTAIQVGIIICLPAIMVGHVLYKQAGLEAALGGLFGGSLLLWGLALLSLKLCLQRPAVIMEIAEVYMGKNGQKLCGLAFACSLCGWFAIQLNLMSQTVYVFLVSINVASFIYPWIITVCLGLLITLLVSRGIKMIGIFANIALPLMIFTLAYVVYTLVENPLESSIMQKRWNLSFAPIALMISSKLAGLVNLPTYYRYAYSSKDAYISVSLVYLFFLPLVGVVGVILAIFAPSLSLIEAITQSGNDFFELWAVIFLVFAGWTTNNGNLFSGAMALSCFTYQKISEKKLILILGGIGTSFACLDILENFQMILNAMGIIVGSMGMLIWTKFIINKFKIRNYTKNEQQISQIIVMTSALFGFCSLFKLFPFSQYAFLDAMTLSFLATLLIEGVNQCYNR